MTDSIRQAVKRRIDELGKSQAEVARSLGLQRQYLGRMLNEHVGEVPESWQQLLDALNLELYVREKPSTANSQKS
ncbi:helix-turn-helix domain-containing protein [Truepera radiovictrix]|jgi:ParB-like chromosome segregation protein Spo0J|uniref:helix-turn-helix domain-containing protein n=1 Tax=Truepera radiovictrix TaxID=332249 RepID=UPI0011D039C0|nr:helix-turn-helix transcriptional regulator [Truepera radiovictrix]WMT57667.1 helix-turn-helix transcriptional regulator [Truepera radiovictrix]WMT57691.1 helix-turn-helix transcriptional regulator [Truepera radiovictrix]WMT57755.1 helix-turn-helix transcriptional regulator [Truepera radiovictrix]